MSPRIVSMDLGQRSITSGLLVLWFAIITCAPLLATIAGVLLFSAATCYGHGEDIVTPKAGAHSTFHYELTRALAYAAGFDRADADEIAVACEATDAQTFGGDLGRTITVVGTERSTPATAQYWHFARRDTMSVSGDFTWPGGRNTCAYFVSSNDPCPAEAELSEIESWAMIGAAKPATGVPSLSTDGVHFLPIAPRSLAALGLHLHAVADSYSHEKCMATTALRTHAPAPSECAAQYWHEQAEYGADAEADVGVPYTKEAAHAVWMALVWYRQEVWHATQPRWSDATTLAFINRWAELDRADDRRELAARVLLVR